MAFTPKITDHPEIPSAVLVSTPDGGRITVPRDRLPQLGLAASGATAQNMSTPEPMMSVSAPVTEATLQRTTPSVSDVGPSMSMAPAPAENMSMVNASYASDAPKEQETQLYQQPQRQPTAQELLIDELQSGYKRVAGTKAFDPVKYDASQKAVRAGQTTQVQGAREFDPGAVEQYQQWEKEAFETGVKASQMQAENDVATQKIAAEENAKLLAKQAEEQKAMEDSYNSRVASLQDEAKAIGAKQVDPKRVFSSMGTFQKLMLVAASGLSGYATKGQKNVALEQMEATIDRDVRAQEQQLQNSKSNVDNALSRLSQEWGSILAGKAALRVEQREALKHRLGAIAAETGQQAAMVKAQAAIQALDAQQAKDFETLRVASMGETTTATQARFMAPRAATAGGLVRKSLKERAADLQTAQKIEQGDISNEEGTLKNIERRKSLSGEVPSEVEAKNIPHAREQLGKGLAEVANLRTNVEQIMSRAGITVDKDGNAVHGSIPGVGIGYSVLEKYPVIGKELAAVAASAFGGKDGAVIRNQAMEALTYKIKEASGAAFSKDEAALHALALGQGLLQGEDAFAQALVNFQRSLDEKEASLRAGAGIAASRSYDASKQVVDAERDYARSGVRGAYRGTVAK